ncbi:hypothetical protein MTO96_010873 [Rhipicephalus appendiculatus]
MISQCRCGVIVLFALLGSYVHCCRHFQVAQGARLLQLKGILREVLDQCGKTFHKALAMLPRQEVQRLFDCFSAALEDKDSVFYTSANISAGQSYAIIQFMTTTPTAVCD